MAAAPSRNSVPRMKSDAAFNMRLVSACDCRLDLVMSVHVANKHRWSFDAVNSTASQFDVLLYALRSYAPLPFERVYLYVELDARLQSRSDELRTAATQLFGRRLVTLQPRRLTTQDAWRSELKQTIAPPSSAGVGDADADGRLVWFLQRSDLIYIDRNADVLCEGLARMRADPSRFKSLYMSHWASALALSGKVAPPTLRGSYLVSQLTMLDSVQVLNFRYLHHLLSELDWKGRQFKRIDMMIRQRQIYDTDEVGPKAHLAWLFATSDSLQTFYAPLRELCRKFDAYMEMSIDVNVTRPLVLPPRANVATGTLTRDPRRLVQMLAAPGRVLWTMENPFRMPQAWALRALSLHRNAAVRHPARMRVCRDGNASNPLLRLFDDAVAAATATPPPATCAAALHVPAGRLTCGQRIRQLQRSTQRYSRKHAELRVGLDFAEPCGACGPCGGPCHTPAVHVLDDGTAGTEPMEPLRAMPQQRAPEAESSPRGELR